tara:strand:+ start:467 stop:823 length:357 start_codon:yes stop_codon:yes gene_type:complete
MADDKDYEITSLLPDRWYVILKRTEEDSFTMSAYDTTPMPDDNDDFMDAGFVAQQGIIELLENDFDRLIQAGLARISFLEMKETIMVELEEEGVELESRDRVTGRDENVVKVDFGTKQ